MHWILVASSEALRKGQGYQDGMDLHRPGIDQVVLPCPECQADMRRIPDILDVWFDSGVSSWASLGYPGRDDEFRRWWPGAWFVEVRDRPGGCSNRRSAPAASRFARPPTTGLSSQGW